MRGGVFAPAVRAGAGRGEWGGERGAVRGARGAVRRAGRDERGAMRRTGRDGRGGSSQGEVRSAVRNAPACGARDAERGVRCGARRDLGTRGTRPLTGVAAGVGRRHGGFPAGCPGTISVGGCVSRGRAPLAGLRYQRLL